MQTKAIRLSNDVYAYLIKKAKVGENANAVIRRLLKLGPRPHVSRRRKGKVLRER